VISEMDNEGPTSLRICVIGVGNDFRNDDAAGLIVARGLKRECVCGLHVEELSGEGAGLMEAMAGADVVFLVDAVSSGSPVGTTFRIDAAVQTIPSDFFHYSTHAFSVAESVEMARTLGQLPGYCVLFGIEGKDFGVGTTVSKEIVKAAGEVVKAILSEIDSIVCTQVPGV
jgi:hydrogenase maturation protease